MNTDPKLGTIRIGSPSPWSKWDWIGFVLGSMLGGLVLGITFWPGIRDGDTIELIWYVRAGYFSTYQSPLLGVLWKALDQIGGSPMIYIGQVVLVTGATSAALGQFVKGRWLAFILPLVLMSPPLAPYAGTMVKDVWFGCAFLLGITCLWRYYRKPGFAWLGLAFIFFSASFNFRSIGIFGILPVCIFGLVGVFTKRLSPSSTAGPALVILLAAICGLKLMTPTLRLFYRIDPRPAEQVIYLSDLTALTLSTGQWLIPPEANPDNIDSTRLEELFKAHACNNLVTYKPWQKDRLLLTEDPGIVKIYRHAWIKAILNHPIAFAIRRWEVFNYFMGFYSIPKSYEPSGWFYQKVSERYKDGPTFEPNVWSNRYLSLLDWLEEKLPAASLWPYLLLCILSAIASTAKRKPEAPFISMVAAAFVCYSLGFALVTYHTAYRYHWPTAFASMVLLVQLVKVLTSQAIAAWKPKQMGHEPLAADFSGHIHSDL